MPEARLARTRANYSGGVCPGCEVRLDATICRCEPRCGTPEWSAKRLADMERADASMSEAMNVFRDVWRNVIEGDAS